MSEVSRAITDRLKELDWDQKQLAHDWHKKVGSGSVRELLGAADS